MNEYNEPGETKMERMNDDEKAIKIIEFFIEICITKTVNMNRAVGNGRMRAQRMQTMRTNKKKKTECNQEK